jgi:glycosyltransferase involved in cell wall biosynthesis
MPAFNAEHYVAAAIQSVLEQTLGEWELIVVDDGSTDSTPSILHKFEDKRIRIVHQENQGEAGARNTGLDLAVGQYVAFLDADDLYMPNALHELAAYLDTNHNMHVVFSDGYYCDKFGRPIMRLSEHRPGPYTGAILEPLVLSPSVVSVPCSTLFRRQSAVDAGCRFDTMLHYGVDWDFWIQMARVYDFGYLPALTCRYRIHGANMTTTSTLQRRKRDIFAGRRKLLESSWFEELSVPTRKAFFYHVLIDLLSDELAEQDAILRSRQFRSLPVQEQAELYRAVATLDLARCRQAERAQLHLQAALSSYPGDRKSRILSRLSGVSPELGRAAIRSWGVIRSCITKLNRQPHRKPVPSELLPKP